MSTDIVDEMLRLVPPARFIKEDIDGKRDVAIFCTDKITFVHKILSRKVTTIKERWKRSKKQELLKGTATKKAKTAMSSEMIDVATPTDPQPARATATAASIPLAAHMPVVTDSTSPSNHIDEQLAQDIQNNIDVKSLMTTTRNLLKVVSAATGVDIDDDIENMFARIKRHREDNDNDDRKPAALTATVLESPFDDESDIEVRQQQRYEELRRHHFIGVY